MPEPGAELPPDGHVVVLPSRGFHIEHGVGPPSDELPEDDTDDYHLPPVIEGPCRAACVGGVRCACVGVCALMHFFFG